MIKKPYEAYRKSKVKWIGVIPEHWEVKKIKYTTYVKGRIGWQGLKSDEFIDEGPFLVTGTDFNNGVVNWDGCYHISEERYNEALPIQLQEDDLLITKDGSIGKLAMVVNKPEKAILNSGIFVTRPLNNDYFPKFLYWILSSKVFDDFIRYFETGSTIKHLYQETFVNFSYPFPTYSEQMNISNFLDKKCKEIDHVIQLKKKQIETLKQYRQSLISETMTRGLKPNVEMKDSGDILFRNIPSHWEIKKTKNIVKVTDGTHDTPSYIDKSGESVPFITSKDIINGEIDFSNTKYISYENYILINKRSNVKKNDVIMPMIGTVGNAAIVRTDRPFSIKNVALFKTEKDSILSEFLFYLIESNIFKEQFRLLNRGGVQSFLSLGTIQNLKFLFPPKEEMENINQYLNTKVIEIEKLIEDQKNQINIIQKYRQSLIYETVTGKFDVRNYYVSELEVKV
jgi:type I restriction enzyme, S subunit